MMRYFGVAVYAALLCAGQTAFAATEKEKVCAVQGDLMGAIQQARLDGVRKAKLRDTVAEAQPDLSEAVLDTVPQLGDFVYDMRKRDLRKVDLNANAREQCLQQWDQIQAFKKGLSD